MRRWIRYAASLYPRAWQERYGAEFEALLEEVEPEWRQVLDVAGSALKMQIASGGMYGKLAGALAVVGAVVAVAASFVVPANYVSSAVLQVSPAPVGQDKPMDCLAVKQQSSLSRTNLESLIRKPRLALYRNELNTTPMEDVVEHMRRDIQISLTTQHAGESSPTVRISFAYPDRQKAQRVVAALAALFADAPSSEEQLEIVQQPTLPTEPEGPNRWQFAAWGSAAGLLIGLVATAVWRRPKWTAILACFALVGFLVGATLWWRIPKTFTSKAVLVLRTQSSADPSLDAVVERLRPAALNSQSLEGILRDLDLDLYPEERRTMSLDQLTELLSRNIQLEIGPPSPVLHRPMALTISFTYPNPLTAKRVNMELVSRFLDLNTAIRQGANTDAPATAGSVGASMGELNVIEPPHAVPVGIFTQPKQLAAVGLLAGLLLGAITLWLWPSRPQKLRPI